MPNTPDTFDPPNPPGASDTPDRASAHPALTIEESGRLEAALFAGDETREWPAMQRAGRAIAGAVLRDYREIGPFPDDARVLVLVGKGHNGGDALLAAKHILENHPRARAGICFALGERNLRPLTMRAWREFVEILDSRFSILDCASLIQAGALQTSATQATALRASAIRTSAIQTGAIQPSAIQPAALQKSSGAAAPNPKSRIQNPKFQISPDICLDGIFGFQFRPPLDKRTAALIAGVNALPVRLRAAVDLPSGLGGKTTFRADFTYATGIVKTPVLDSDCTGRLRYLDLRFFSADNFNAGSVDLRDTDSRGTDSRGTGFQPVGLKSNTGFQPVSLAERQKPRAGSPCHANHGQDARATLGGFAVTQAGNPCRESPCHSQNPRHFILTPAILEPLRALRPSNTDKRDYGHLLVIGGSRSYPGAVLMSVLAALRGGAGLVTAFVPETLVPAFAARAPEAVWLGLAETPGGALALENISAIRARLAEKPGGTARPTALLLGPGLSREPETLALAADIARATPAGIPLVIDADALQPGVVSAGGAPRVLTPHAGEHARIAAAIPENAVVVRKAPLTRIERAGEKEIAGEKERIGEKKRACDGARANADTCAAAIYISPFGGPVLARGGSGDLLAGIIGTQLAQTPRAPLLAACRGTVWHGMAADCLARARGQRAVRATELLDYLPEALRVE